MKNAYFIPNVQYKAPKKIDPLRVSQSISKNMMKDLNKDGYGGEKEPKDFNLINRDQEITIGENKDDNVEKDQKSIPGEDLSLIEKTEIEGAKGGAILGDKNKAATQKQRPGQQDEIRKDTTNVGPMGLDPNAQSTPQSKVPLKTIDQLLIHNSDTAVKPIIGNKDIEKTGELVYNP